jgi:hypothetical protein
MLCRPPTEKVKPEGKPIIIGDVGQVWWVY